MYVHTYVPAYSIMESYTITVNNNNILCEDEPDKILW